ncbi:MAG TPA: hypothetical protein VFF30_06020 [Nitrososphaerales archaeon]|nr:hypothetical protein [Nitrososphaerales archaeon]
MRHKLAVITIVLVATIVFSYCVPCVPKAHFIISDASGTHYVTQYVSITYYFFYGGAIYSYSIGYEVVTCIFN